MSNTNSYDIFADRMAELRYLNNGLSILSWDTKTYMPPEGIAQRGQQLGILSRMGHELLTKPENGVLIAEAMKMPDLSSVQKRNLELWKKDYERATKIPSDLVMRLIKQQTLTESLWEKAKDKSNFKMIIPDLQKLVELVHKQAEALNPEIPHYNTLVDLYEPNITPDIITAFFDPLKEASIKLINKSKNVATPPNPDILKVIAPVDQQRKLSKIIMDIVGLDPTRTRIDEVEHPFTTGYAGDVRITTHYLANDPFGSIYSVFHEAGHALYESNLPKEHWWTAVGESVSMGIHESQSRFFENMVGKNPIFLEHFLPKVKEIIPSVSKYENSEIIRAINAISPSNIRIYADEITYNLHIILRFEIERDLFAGKISVSELPLVWNEKMDKYLGIEITDDKEGVLQDTHWYGGLFGYFPDYALGNIYNGQMFEVAKKAVPDWAEKMAQGNIDGLRQWMIDNVHHNASLYDPIPLMENICGTAPDAKYFIDYMNDKFGKIYKF